MTCKRVTSIPCDDHIIISINMADLPLLIDYYSKDKNIKNDKSKKKRGKLMSAREVSKYLRIKLQILYYLVDRKSIPFIKKGNFLYFDKKQIQEWFIKKENIDLIEKIQKSNFFSSL